MTANSTSTGWEKTLDRLGHGGRLIGLFGTPGPEPGVTVLTTALAVGDEIELIDREVGEEFPALTPAAPAALWYERLVHDHFGVLARDHPRLDPLVLAGVHDQDGDAIRPPRPGSGTRPARGAVPSEDALPRYLRGDGLFTIPHGPVRSGVVESLEYLVETPGEDIPRLQIRVFAKHRGVEIGFEGRTALVDGVYCAERVEGTASVAHATAYCQALERLAGASVPEEAALVRLLHAELERIAGHLEVVARLCEAAALAVGLARFTQYKEEVQRIRHRLCGSRFGRGVVVPGGVTPQNLDTLRQHADLQVRGLADRIRHDRDLLMVTSSFLDRLRGTGVLLAGRAAECAAVGPVGRASGMPYDVRHDRPYDAYQDLTVSTLALVRPDAGDVQARLEVRWEEIEVSFGLVDRALDILARSQQRLEWVHPLPAVDGRAVGAVEGPQGEVVYVVEVREGRLRRVWPRTASFHNLPLFHDVFHTDVLTDFPFIEASFAVSNAGVVM